MSEVQSRPAARGRGSARGGRGGHFARGGRGGARTTKPSSQENVEPQSYEDEGDFGQLKKKHSDGLATIKELFTDWTDEDLVFALEDADGDLEIAIERITEGLGVPCVFFGNVSQWGEVKKKNTDRSRQKPKESQPASVDMTVQSARGGRGRGGFESRGRGRGDRGRAGRGGRAGGHINGTTRPVKPPTQPQEETEPSAAPVDAWPTETPSNEAKQPPSDLAATDASKPVEQPQKSTIIPEGSKKGWASLFAKPAPAPPQKEPPPPHTTTAAPEKPAEPNDEARFAEQPAAEPEAVAKEALPVELEPTPPTSLPAPTSHVENDIISKPTVDEGSREPQLPQPVAIPVSEKEAVSHHQPQQQQQPQQVRVPVPVPSYPYNKPAVSAGRTPNMQRRVMEQQEAVVMPANHAVDRAAVQFGSMGLNGSIDDVDIDEEREEPETRPQPPQHSPVAPRASLPPSTRAPTMADTTTIPAIPRPAPGLPPAPPTTSADAHFSDFARYGETHKPYDPFGQQVEQPQQQIQEPFSNQGAIPSQPAAVTTAADYSAFYGADQSRNPYYYGSYGQPQEPAATQHRIASGFGTTGAEAQPQIPASQPPTRYSHVEAPNSGQNTPNPTLPAQVQSGQPSQHMPQGQGAHGAYNYGYPYYSNPHYPSAYMNQMTGQQHQYGRNRPMFDDARRYEDSHYVPHGSQFGYGNQYAPYAKGGMYAQPQHGFTYDHSSSPANAGAFNQAIPGRDAAYGRTGSTQPSEAQQTAGNTAFGGIPDVFGRTQSGFGHNQPMGSQQPVNTDESSNAKGFEAPKAGGPSPSVSHVNRPGSATSNVPTQPTAGQAGLPPVPAAQQANHQAFGGYPHLNPQYGGLGGLGAHHQAASQTHHQGTGYGNYAAGFGTNYYGNTGRGGGWGGNYGH